MLLAWKVQGSLSPVHLSLSMQLKEPPPPAPSASGSTWPWTVTAVSLCKQGGDRRRWRMVALVDLPHVVGL